jgi:hypothetical protein
VQGLLFHEEDNFPPFLAFLAIILLTTDYWLLTTDGPSGPAVLRPLPSILRLLSSGSLPPPLPPFPSSRF